MINLNGIGASDGLALGKLFFYDKPSVQIPYTKIIDAEKEIVRWKNAVDIAKTQLMQLYQKTNIEAGAEAAEIFEIHCMMLDDLDYNDAVTSIIKNKLINAEYAVNQTAIRFAEIFSSMDNEYMNARSADVFDISQRVIDILSKSDSSVYIGDEPVIIAADDLSPSQTMRLDSKLILGFLLRKGSLNSHTAIIARTLGIPAVINLGNFLNSDYHGQLALINGCDGCATINPDEDTLINFNHMLAESDLLRDSLDALKGQDDFTTDGRELRILANINSPDDVEAVINNDARGIGLFRSEFLYLKCSDYPNENSQFLAYKKVLSRMNNNKVVIRTLDIGADKKVDYFNLPNEENPALGFRALRICLSRTDMFKTQLRALYRASAFGNLAVLIPFVTSVWEIREVKALCNQVQAELVAENITFNKNLELGIMIETPASVIIASDLAKEVNFFSIGTNDLTQYTLAADRHFSGELSRFYDTHHPAVLEMIRMTVQAAHANNIKVCICGQIAADSSLTKTFVEMGVDELSVPPCDVLPIRYALKNIIT